MEYWSYPEFSKSIESDRVRVDCGFDACPLFVQKIWHVANERGGGFDTPLESWKWFAYLRMHLIIRAQGGWQKFLLVRNTKWQNRFLEEEWKQAFGLRELNSRSTSNHSAFHAAQPLLLSWLFSWLLSRPSLLTRLRSPTEPLLPSSPFSESCLSQLRLWDDWTLVLSCSWDVVFDWSTFTVASDSGDNSLVNSSKR